MIDARPASVRAEDVTRSFTADGRSHHVFVPRENALGFFATHDGTVYRRDAVTGTIRRALPKPKGKAARKAAKAARRRHREATAADAAEQP